MVECENCGFEYHRQHYEPNHPLQAELVDTRNAIKLMIGCSTRIPWRVVPDDDVVAVVDFVRKQREAAGQEGMMDNRRCLICGAAFDEVERHYACDCSLDEQHAAKHATKRLVAKIKRLEAIADAVDVLDGKITYDYAGVLSKVTVDRDKFDALHVAWSNWKAAEAEGNDG